MQLNEERADSVGARGIQRAAPSDTRRVYIPVTLCRFDDKYSPKPKTGPFIPCERRLAILEIVEIQGRDFVAGF